ncbi:lytic murein transglycosylase [Kumtagia ephedrae]|jgi:lytic murein transglycosylase|uniref:Murein transglycosylase n=1 Tax=Kumtagia ephedrae TaxID=2116701 RepID=A0A2P7S5F2_9HYPH|nr:lytic transglycosylase domain-containing protein [Mesorhizobium ephedrae]PSJ57682.1 murein transglycosylase [Mesorhizobium ephedrae]
MAFTAKTLTLAIAASAMLGLSAVAAEAARCGKSAAGFEAWKAEFAREAAANGVGQRGLAALAGTRYSTKTIGVDRAVRKAFSGSVDSFMKRRGGAAIISKGRSLKKQNAALFASIEKRYGVPAGPLLAIWGMETGFGAAMGNQNTVSAVATLAYDCRRPEFFTNHLYGALKLVDRGGLSAGSVGAAHGEIGHTQFLPANVLKYGVDGNGDGRVDLRNKADALASTANFLRGHGYGGGPASANRGAIAGWNAASVYQQAIIIMADAIDGG